MVNIIVELSKYLIIILMTMYTYLCFSIFGYYDPDKKKRMLRRQNVLMFTIHIIAFLVMYLEKQDVKLLAFYLMQVVLFGTTILLYTFIYPKVSRLVVNNMCMLLCIGMIMLTRLNYEKAVKQYVIAAGAIAASFVIPVIIRKFKKLSEWRNLYAIAGIVSLAIVAVVGQVSYGAKLGFTVGGISIQPSELVKIIFVFFVAAYCDHDGFGGIPCADSGSIQGPWGSADHLCRISGNALCGYPPAAVSGGRAWRGKRGVSGGLLSFWTCTDACHRVERSLCVL